MTELQKILKPEVKRKMSEFHQLKNAFLPLSKNPTDSDKEEPVAISLRGSDFKKRESRGYINFPAAPRYPTNSPYKKIQDSFGSERVSKEETLFKKNKNIKKIFGNKK